MLDNILSKVVYVADGTQKQWDIPFEFYRIEDVHIYITSDGEHIEEIDQNYYYDEEGKFFIYPTEESELDPIPAGTKVLILRETKNTQEEDSSDIYFKSKDIERGLDKLTMQVQDLKRETLRAVKLSHFSTQTPEDFTKGILEAEKKATEAASKASLSEQNAVSSASSAQSASATAIAASQLVESLKSDAEEFAKRAENAASDASASASQASDLLQEISNSTYNKEQIDEKVAELENAQASAIAGKQDKLVAGANITINGNVISSTGAGGGGSSEAVWGAIAGDINAQTDLTNLIDAKTASIAEKQDKLTAGEGITIEGNVISATGGGGSAELPDNVYTQDNLVAGENIQIKEVVNPNVIDDNTLLCWHFDGDTKDVVNGEDFTLYPGYGTLNTTYYKFGTASAPDYVQNGLYITLKEPLTDKDNFTLDYWIYGHGADTDTLSFTTRLAGGIGTTNGTSIYLRAFGNDQNLLDVSDADGNYVGSLAKTNFINSKEWSHWAYTYNKDTREFSVYANGVKQGAYAFPSGNPFNIEIIYPVDTNYNQFAIDEFRLTKALAWDKNFTPPTEAYTKGEGVAKKAISAIIPPVELPSDLYRQSNLLGGKDIEIIPEPVDGGIDEHTIGMWHFDTDGKDEITGTELSYFTSDRIISSDFKFGTGCLYSNNAQAIGTFSERNLSYTVDMWYKHTAEYSNFSIGINCDTYSSTDSPTNGYRLIISGTNIKLQHTRYYENNTTFNTVTFPFYSSSTWHHIAVQKIKNEKIQVYVDGSLLIEQDIDESLVYGSKVIIKGQQYVDELRLSDTIRWTENFTPPTKPYHKAEPTGNYLINFTGKVGEVGGSNSSLPLFYHTFADHILNDASWLRGDTFSWQSGDIYVSAYNHLVADYEGDGKQKNTTVYSWAFGEGYSGYNPYTLSEKPSNGSLVFWADIYSIKGILGRVVSFDEETNSFEYEDYKAGTTKIAISPTSKEKLSSFAIDTIGSTEITFYCANDGHKIVLTDQESKVSDIYRATGVAWYYILDTENKRFKLPRTKHAFAGLRTVVGNFVEAGLPNITGQTNFAPSAGMRNDAQPRGAFYKATATGYVTNFSQASGNDLGFDASLSSEVYGKSDTVQPNATEQYLYFYVGNTVRNQTEVEVGAVTEQLNGKSDLNLSNANPSKSFRENVFNWGLPDLTSGVTKSWNTDITAETNGWVRFNGNLVDDGAAMVMSINGQNVFYLAYRYDAQGTVLQMMPVSKGDVYKCYGAADSQAITFYPCKGEVL